VPLMPPTTRRPSAEPEPKQDHPHIQYLDQPFIRLILERAEKEEKEEKANRPQPLFGEAIKRLPAMAPSLDRNRGREERELEL
jgi:hypothetical protein